MSSEMNDAADAAFFRDLDNLVREIDAEAAPQMTEGASDETRSEPTSRSTREAWFARIRMNQNRAALRRYARQVTSVLWNEDSTPENHAGKKIPFSLNKADVSGLKQLQKTCLIKGEEDLFPRQTQSVSLDFPEEVLLPRWKDLPGTEHRCPYLAEIVTGLRIASVFQGDDASLASWWSAEVDEDACALSVDLRGDDASRFLIGERGSAAAAVKRRVRRPLERFLGDANLGAVWTDIAEGDQPRVRLFLFVRSGSLGSAADAIEMDRSDRYVRSLRKHGVPLPPDDMPVWINDLSEKAKYFRISLDELWDRMDLAPREEGHISKVDEQEFTPETGFVSASVISARAEQSRDRWRRIAAQHRLPVWFSERLARCLRDQLMPRPESARWRQPIGLTVYRGSPACLAAVAIRSGRVLGDYFDSRHKAAVPARLYKELRSLNRGR